MKLRKTSSALVLASALGLPGAGANAQPQPHAAAAYVAGSKDPAAAPAGQYRLDPAHSAVLIRMLHEGSSYSIFRFNMVSGALSWNPAQVEASKVEVSVESASISTPVPNFSETLSSPRFLNAAAYPEVKFVSTGIHRTGPTSGDIAGDLTMLGKAKPIVIHAEMVGVGHLARDGTLTIGFSGSAKFKRSDFGMTALFPIVPDDGEIMIEAEFDATK